MDRRWLAGRELSPRAELRLFCLPYAGGGAAAYRRWQSVAPDRCQVLALELPGRGIRLREAPYLRLAPLIRALTEALVRADALDRPYALFGHSMGGLLAFELARALRRHPVRQPTHLFVSAAPAPDLPLARPPLHHAVEEELLARLGDLNGTPRELLDNEELMSVLLPVLRADFSVVETYRYRPEPPLGSPLTVFGGRADPIVPLTALPGWRRQTTAGSRLRLFPGDHFYLHSVTTELMAEIVRDLNLPAPVDISG